MSSDTQSNRPLSEEELQDLVASSDAGGRNPVGNVGVFLAVVAAIWSIFQVVLASPLANYVLPGSIVNNARQFHLAFAMFLAFAATLSAASKVADPSTASERLPKVPIPIGDSSVSP